MKNIVVQVALVVLFIFLGILYYSMPLEDLSVDKTFLTLSTFLFALLAGFFISRQAGRYGELRKLTANFDGDMSSLYRAFGHYSAEAQNEAGKVIKKHYQNIVSGGWDYPLTHKTSTITDLHIVMEEAIKKNSNDGINGAVTVRGMLVLSDLQKIRKGMASLRGERIPNFQWMLVYLLTVILILVVSTVDSHLIILGSIVKSAFVVAVVSVVVLLKKLDSLQLFSGAIGEASALDVIEIIDGKK